MPISMRRSSLRAISRSQNSDRALEAHLDQWTREIADRRVHGTTGEVPIERFQRAEASTLRPIATHPGGLALTRGPLPYAAGTHRPPT